MGDDGLQTAALDSAAPSGVVSLDGRFLRVSPALAAALGSDPGAMMALGAMAVTHPDDRDRLTAMLGLMRAGSIGETKFRQRWLRAGGEAVEGLVSGSVIREDGAPAAFAFSVEIGSPRLDPPGWESVFANAGQETAMIGLDGRRLRVNDAYASILGSVPSRGASIDTLDPSRSRHDGVTGLPAATQFIARLEPALAGVGAASVAVLVIGVEIERRGVVEPPLISQATVLREIADRITAKLKPDRFVARLGDWSFAILLVGGDELTLAASARFLLKATSEPIVVSGEPHPIHATLGIAVASRGDDPGDLIEAAERARRRARELGADRFEFAELGDRRPESPVQELLDDIRHALAREELRLRYQPVFDLADRSICGVEVLLRWEHPSRTVLTPEMFLPAARRTGAIAPIGRWVLEQSLSQLAQWNDELELAAPLLLFINLSAPELADPSLVDAVARALERARVRPEQLALDISDAALIEVYGPAWRSIVALRELGVAIVLDRLGTTFSSLAHLEQLPIDLVKLDRSCVASLPDDPRDRAAVKAALGVAEARGLTSIACGVETERQVQILAALGCTAAQGFLFAEPRAARAVTKLLRWRGERTSRAAS